MTTEGARVTLKDILKVRSEAYYDYIQNGGKADVAEEAYFDVLNTAIKVLEKPEIIYCKNCKHYNNGDCEEMPKLVSEDDYCSWAKRR